MLLTITSENKWKIGNFALTRSIWSKILGRRGRPHQLFCMHYNFAADSFHTKKLCSRLS